MNRQFILAVDFDGTITKENTYPIICNKPNKPVIEFIHWVQSLNWIIILWTCRSGESLDAALKYCKDYDLKIDYVNRNAYYVNLSSPKIFADIYLDDRSLNTDKNSLKKLKTNVLWLEKHPEEWY